MDGVKFTIRNLQQFKAELDKADDRRVKAAQTATRVESYRLSQLLKKEIRHGAPGGRRFDPLTEIGRRTRASYLRGERDIQVYGGKRLGRQPLERLAVPVRYDVRKDKNSMNVQIGFVERGRNISKSWQRIVKKMQEGYTIPVSEKLRKSLRREGGRLKKRGIPEARYFFLKPTTTSLKVPARPIIDPFWRAHEREVFPNIQRNFEKKMAGERI